VRLSGFLHYDVTDALALDVLQRWRDAMKLSGVPGEVWSNNRLEAFGTTNVTLTYKAPVRFETELFLSIQNLFDATPPTGGFTGNGTRAGLRDGYAIGDNPLGRYLTIGLRARM